MAAPAWTDTAPSASAVVLIAIFGALAGIVMVAMAMTNPELHQPGMRAMLACWITIPYIAAGVVAWKQKPASKLGLLMVIAGFATFPNFLVWSANDLLFTIGTATQLLPPVLFLHVFLSFPSGRLGSRLDRGVVWAAYGAAALAVPAILLGLGAPRNVLALAAAPSWADFLQSLQLLVLSGLMLLGIGLLIRTRRRNGPPLRVSMTLLVDAFSLGLLMVAALLMAGWLEWSAFLDPLRHTTFSVVGLAPIVFLIGLLQAHLGRAWVGELLVSPDTEPGPVELQEAVARALRDPSARLAYWLPEVGSYSDVDGRLVEAHPGVGRSETPIMRRGVPVAMLHYSADLEDEPALVGAVAAAAGMVIHNAALQVELRSRLEELRGSRARIVEAEDRERRRLERNLHDGAQQRLVALALELSTLGELVSSDEVLRTRVDAASSEVAASLAELRDLARGIHPAGVSDHGLAVALESLATRASVPVRIVGVTDERLPEHVELAAYFLVCEGLANIARHAGATSAVIELKREGSNLLVDVTDDGVGGANRAGGTGIRGLADRVETLGGHLQVWSPPGEGTRLSAMIPCV